MIYQKQIEEQIEYYRKNDIYCTAGDIVETYVAVGKINIEDTLPKKEYKEVMEWWFVSAHLAEWLERTGAVVVRTDYLLPIWGRTETGQSLALDSDLERAAVALLQEVERVTSKYNK